MTTYPVAGRASEAAPPDLDRARRYRTLTALAAALALVPVWLLLLVFSNAARTAQDASAIAQCERFGAEALAVYSVTHNAVVAQSLAAVRSAVAAPPAVFSTPIPGLEASSPPTYGLSAADAARALSGVPGPDTAGMDWHPLLLSMTKTQRFLTSAYPQQRTLLDPAWSAFVASVNDSGAVDWKTADNLRVASDGFAAAVLSDSARRKMLVSAYTVASVVIAACLLLPLVTILRRMRETEDAMDEQRNERETLLESTGEGICALDHDGLCTYVNTAAAQMLGYRTEELIGKSLHFLIHHSRADGSPLPPEEDAILCALQTGETCRRDEDVVWRRDGSPLPVQYTCAPLQTGAGVRGAVVAFADVTERKELQTLRDDLNGMIVHDLRTPLTSLLTGLQTLEMMGGLNAQQQEFLGIAVQGGQTLLGMVNDLLDISKLEAGSLKLQREEFAAADLVTLALTQVTPLATRNGLRIAQRIAPDLPVLTADRELIRRALVNLLGNAVKFTPRAGIVTVAVFYEDVEAAVVFAVGDTGEGIPAHALRRIFEKFGQVETRKAGHKMSTGLGLTFCKLVAESHGGRIWVESKLGKGSRFLFSIPLYAVPLSSVASSTPLTGADTPGF